MRRIIEGKAYNTETAAKVAFTTRVARKAPFKCSTLFLNRDGRYFLHYEGAPALADVAEQGREGDEAIELVQTPGEITEMRRLAAEHTWQVNDDQAWTRIVEGAAPPAGKRRKGSPAAGGSVLLIRVPQSLKERVESAAAAEGMSINAWVMRRLESSLA